MDNKKDNKKSIQDKLSTIKYNCSCESHLKVNQEICAICDEKTCTFICPADVYSIDPDTDEIIIQYENCLECGACKIACKLKSLEWEYPKQGYGVIYKNS